MLYPGQMTAVVQRDAQKVAECKMNDFVGFASTP
jgi:hypothetical protein